MTHRKRIGQVVFPLAVGLTLVVVPDHHLVAARRIGVVLVLQDADGVENAADSEFRDVVRLEHDVVFLMTAVLNDAQHRFIPRDAVARGGVAQVRAFGEQLVRVAEVVHRAVPHLPDTFLFVPDYGPVEERILPFPGPVRHQDRIPLILTDRVDHTAHVIAGGDQVIVDK